MAQSFRIWKMFETEVRWNIILEIKFVMVSQHHGKYVMRCTISYHLYNLKNVKKTHGGVSIFVKLQAFIKLIFLILKNS